tara:strand:- start:93 stop:1112 length:1020 start_codon:yes stop_codon:yes gene_type:complete
MSKRLIGILVTLCFCFQISVFATGSTNGIKIAADIAKNATQYMSTKVIGACVWLQCVGPYCWTSVTPELDQFLPDLVVTVHNHKDDNPWLELRETTDKVAYLIGNKALQLFMGAFGLGGVKMSGGGTTANTGGGSHSGYTQKYVEVTGSPFYSIPYLMLRFDTTPYMPYYNSSLDSVPGRLGFAEMLRWQSYSPLGPYIGDSFADHWGYMYPRNMAVNSNNPYKAAVIAAMHASALVTNTATMHVVQHTQNSCGQNCAVSNVKAETGDSHQKWQEVYPNDHKVIPGKSDLTSTTPLGQADYEAGNGNFAFVLWRHYRGCIQHAGKLIFYTVAVPPTKKD